MTKEFLRFGIFDIEKVEFHCFKRAIAISDRTTNIMSDEFRFAKNVSKYFVVNKNVKEITLLCVLLIRNY